MRVFSFSSRFITGSYDRTCKVWKTATGDELLTLEGHKNVVYAIAFNNPYGDKIVTGSFDKTAKVNLICPQNRSGCPDHDLPTWLNWSHPPTTFLLHAYFSYGMLQMESHTTPSRDTRPRLCACHLIHMEGLLPLGQWTTQQKCGMLKPARNCTHCWYVFFSFFPS